MSAKLQILVKDGESAAHLANSLKRLNSSLWNSEYSAYLVSPEWKEKREKVLRRDGNKCRICGKKASQVHHLSYARLFAESLHDLVSLCDECHDLVGATVEHKPRLSERTGYVRMVPGNSIKFSVLINKLTRLTRKLDEDAGEKRKLAWRKPRPASKAVPNGSNSPSIDLLAELKGKKK